MKSKIKKYDMYESGEYIPNITNKEMTFYKMIDKIPDDELKLMILRQMDKINRYSDIVNLLFFIAVLILGCFLGGMIIWSYYYNLGLIP